VYITLNPGNTHIQCGLSANQLKESSVEARSTTRHSLMLESLTPGITYHMEVSSRNEVGVDTAMPLALSTSSKRIRLSADNQASRPDSGGSIGC
jgi:hypothetical protein